MNRTRVRTRGAKNMRTDADHLPRVRDPAVELLLSRAGQYDNDWSQSPAAQLVEDLAASVPAPPFRVTFEVQRCALRWITDAFSIVLPLPESCGLSGEGVPNEFCA